jgi:parallel beta-helix repeat protein
MKVFVAEGLYSTESGEIFPLVVGDGVSLVGEDWETTRIKGGSSGSGDADVAVSIAGNECKFESFEVSGDSAVTELKIVGTAAGARISSIRLPRVDTVGVRVGACTDVCIDSCYAVNPYKCYCGAGIRFEGGDTGTVVRGCRLTDFSRAIEFAGSSDACVEGCDLDGNAYGIYLLDTGDPEGGPNPDLGGGARACPGGNILSCGCGLMNLTPNTIYARSNTWNHYPPVEGEEFRNLGGGQVIW